MSFVSYAQNFEDVMLARVFRGIDPGFYIDVGAQDPRIDSVTKAFYDLGWHGINLEPVPSWCEKLRQDRPRDINLCMAAGDAEGQVEFHEVVDTGLSTSSADFAERHREQGRQVLSRQVRVRTLDAICAEHGVGQVHFLKVDAEGDEAAVLRGIDLARLRPWVILVEATEPNSPVSTHTEWESLIVGRGYDFVYNDGLNRFYLASEHAALRTAFATPPNVYDDFVLRQIVDHRNHEEGLGRHIAVIEDLSRLRAEQIDRLDGIVAEKDAALADTHALLLRTQAEETRLHEAVVERERSLSALHKQLSDREADLSALRAALAERDASLALLQARIAEHEIELQARQSRIAALAARLRASEQAVADLSRALLDSQAGRLAAEAGWAASLAEHRATLDSLAQAQSDYQDILASTSWRLTSPLRRMVTMSRSLRGRIARALGWTGATTPTPVLDAGVAGDVEPAGVELAASAVPAPPRRPLPISEDAERILARCPVIDPARIHEDEP